MNITQQYEKLYWNNCIIIANNIKNNCVGLKTGDVCLIENFGYNNDGQQIMVGRYFLPNNNIYDTPCEFGALSLHLLYELSELYSWSIHYIKRKYFLYTYPWKNLLYFHYYILIELNIKLVYTF